MNTTLELARELIGRRSVTPEDGGCQQLVAARLERCGFRAEHLRYADVVRLATFDGRHGSVSDEQRAAGITEGEREFVFVTLVGGVR